MYNIKQTHGYEDLFSGYMSMLENRASPSYEENAQSNEVDEYINNLLSVSSEESQVGNLDFSSLDRLEQNLNDQLRLLEDRMVTLQSSQLPVSKANISKQYDYSQNVNKPVTVSSGQGSFNAGNIRDTRTGKFRSFNTPEEGFNALVNQLDIYKTDRSRTGIKSNSTLVEAMRIYAPASDNNRPDEYARFIAKKIGVNINTPISQIDSRKWADAIAIMEGNRSYLQATKKKQYGGETHGYEELFSNYMSMLENNNQQSSYSNYTEEIEEPVNEVDSYINELQTTSFNDRLSQIEESYNERLASITNMMDQLQVMNDPYTEMKIRKSYDYSATVDENESSITPMNVSTDRINFKSSGRHGLSNVGQKGVEIGNTIAQMLGYTPTYNSIYRDKQQQQYYVNKGIGAKNSHHLTGNAIDVTPTDWKKLTKDQEKYIRSKYNVVYHNNHYHVEPKK